MVFFFSEFDKKAENLIENLKKKAIRNLSDEEFVGFIIKKKDSQHKFFIPKEESFTNFPLQAVRFFSFDFPLKKHDKISLKKSCEKKRIHQISMAF